MSNFIVVENSSGNPYVLLDELAAEKSHAINETSASISEVESMSTKMAKLFAESLAITSIDGIPEGCAAKAKITVKATGGELAH